MRSRFERGDSNPTHGQKVETEGNNEPRLCRVERNPEFAKGPGTFPSWSCRPHPALASGNTGFTGPPAAGQGDAPEILRVLKICKPPNSRAECPTFRRSNASRFPAGSHPASDAVVTRIPHELHRKVNLVAVVAEIVRIHHSAQLVRDAAKGLPNFY